MLDFLINGLIDGALASIISKKIFTYGIALLMAMSGIAFGYLFGYMAYDLIIEPKSIIEIVVIGIMSLFALGLLMGSFYLMKRAWKSRND